MINENARIHWLRIQQPTVVSQLFKKDGHDIVWTVTRTGRIGFLFRAAKGIAEIELYDEVSYKVSSNLPMAIVLQLDIEDAREPKLLGTLRPGRDPNCDEREKLIREIAETAADNHIVDKGMYHLLWRLLLWVIKHDTSIENKLQRLYPEWAKNVDLFPLKDLPIKDRKPKKKS